MERQSFLSDIDQKSTKKAVEAALKKYRLYKYLSFDPRQARITTSYSDIPLSSPTNVASDHTSTIAIHNVDDLASRIDYCEQIELAVKHMPRWERFLLEERYMTNEHDYITDLKVYNFSFEPPISKKAYMKIRWNAFYKLALAMNLIVQMKSN